MTDVFERLKASLADRYAIEREVGSGGMATVYLAEDLKHHRKVAVKVLRPDLAAALGPERFLREIEIAAGLSHPHILPLHDSGEADGFLYYVMPFVEGESLRAKLAREGELPIGDAVRILRDVVDALASAHKHGVVHRDIKPDNVLLSENHALVTDFGVAKAVSEATGRQQLTTAGVALGTPAYMAPEQAVADPHIDHRADIYAVGALAYELLTGRPPFTGTTPQEVLAAQVTEAPQAVTQHRESVPPALAQLVMKCLEKKPADRWQDADEVLRGLEALVTPSGGITPTDTRPVAGVARGRPRAVVATAAVGVITVAAVLVWWASGSRGEVPELDPNLVAAFPFRMTGADEQLRYLGEGIVDLLQANLTGEGGPRAVASHTAISAWKRRGGSSERNLSEDEARGVARSVGAGLLLQGSVVGSPGNMVLNATLTEVEGNGAPAQGSVSGPVDSVVVLVNRLTAQLLSLRAGEEGERAAALANIPLPALRAYLEGQVAYRESRWEEALQHFGQALQVDSTFALAALGHSFARAWVLGAPPSPGARIAWEQREQLSERDRLLLEAWRPRPEGPVSYAEGLAARERAAVALGDRPDAWYLLGDWIFHFGELLGMHREQVKERTWAAFQRGLDLDPEFGPILTHKFDQANWDQDTAYLRQLADSFPEILAVSVRQSFFTASLLGDSAAVARWRSGLSGYSDAQLLTSAGGAFRLGLLDDAFLAVRARTRQASTADQRWGSLRQWRAFAWNTGQPRAAAELSVRIRNELRPLPHANLWDLVFAALFADGDTVQAREAVRTLTASADASLDSVERQQVRDICYLAIWHAARGERARAERLRERLRPLLTLPVDDYPQVMAEACDLQLAALLAGPSNVREAADRLDSLSLTGPDIGALQNNMLNLILARVMESQGRTERALAAVRRQDVFGFLAHATMLRDEGRLALLSADTAGAIYAWDWYLKMRGQAEPEQRAQDDEIRAQLARLVLQ